MVGTRWEDGDGEWTAEGATTRPPVPNTTKKVKRLPLVWFGVVGNYSCVGRVLLCTFLLVWVETHEDVGQESVCRPVWVCFFSLQHVSVSLGKRKLCRVLVELVGVRASERSCVRACVRLFAHGQLEPLICTV